MLGQNSLSLQLLERLAELALAQGRAEHGSGLLAAADRGRDCLGFGVPILDRERLARLREALPKVSGDIPGWEEALDLAAGEPPSASSGEHD